MILLDMLIFQAASSLELLLGSTVLACALSPISFIIRGALVVRSAISISFSSMRYCLAGHLMLSNFWSWAAASQILAFTELLSINN
jgi:hypothetical protein